MADTTVPIAVELIERRIFIIRGQKVMSDSDLALVYGVSTKAFNQAVKRNRCWFPDDFMIQLTEGEATTMRSHFVTASRATQHAAPSLCLHGTGSSHAFVSARQRTRRAGEHRDRAGVRSTPPGGAHTSGSGLED